MLSICYITCRKEPHIEWFYESLLNQAHGNGIRIIVVDFYKDQRDTSQGIWKTISEATVHTAPKPNVWQGPHRLTKEDWWANANARNTALCLAPDGWIAYVDDLSVVLPGWLDRVKLAMEGNYIVCGAYQKVNNLIVEDGQVKAFEEIPHGIDSRSRFITADLTPCNGEWFFGCSVACPVEWFLQAGGWPEISDGLKFEDCLMGVCLQNNGFPFKYDCRMMTYESEELHHGSGTAFKSSDKGVSPNDKSHAVLNIALKSKYYPNYYAGGMRQLRSDVLSGKPFPTNQIPQHDWYDGQPISKMI